MAWNNLRYESSLLIYKRKFNLNLLDLLFLSKILHSKIKICWAWVLIDLKFELYAFVFEILPQLIWFTKNLKMNYLYLFNELLSIYTESRSNLQDLNKLIITFYIHPYYIMISMGGAKNYIIYIMLKSFFVLNYIRIWINSYLLAVESH